MMAHCVNAKKAGRGITLGVKMTGVKKYVVRLKIGVWLIKMGCKVIGCNVHIESDKRLTESKKSAER